MHKGYFSFAFIVDSTDLKLLYLLMVSDVRKQSMSMKCKHFDVHR